MCREQLELLVRELGSALAAAGVPVQLTAPETAVDKSGEPVDVQWSAAAQLQPELEVWDTLTAELVRQVHVECHQRGELLARAVVRQRQLLHDALMCCDRLHQQLLTETSPEQQRQLQWEHEAALEEQAESHAREQQHAQGQLHMLRLQLEAAQAEAASLRAANEEAQAQMEQQEVRLRRGRWEVLQDEVARAKVKLEAAHAAEVEWQVRRAQRHVADELIERARAVVAAAAGDAAATAVVRELEQAAAAVECEPLPPRQPSLQQAPSPEQQPQAQGTRQSQAGIGGHAAGHAAVEVDPEQARLQEHL